MGWIWSIKGNPDLYRQPLVQVLTHLHGSESGRTAARIGRVLERLAQGPPPTGLAREVAAILELIERSSGPAMTAHAELPAQVGRLIGRLSTTLRLGGLLDEELEQAIVLFSGALPLRIGPSDVPRIENAESSLRRVAVRARGRAMAHRTEVASLVTEIAAHLPSALRSSDGVQSGIASLQQEVALIEEAEQLGVVRARLTEGLAGMAVECARLDAEVRAAQRQIATLRQALGPEDQREFDPLTGLLTSSSFREEVAQSPAACVEGALYLALIEVDDLAGLARRYGESARQDVLSVVARTVAAASPGVRCAGHCGEVRFGLLVDLPVDADVQAWLAPVQAGVAQRRIRGGGRVFSATISAGMVRIGGHDADAGLALALDALLESQSTGPSGSVVAA